MEDLWPHEPPRRDLLLKVEEMTSEPGNKLPYWKTGRSSPDEWLRKAIREIEKVGGEVNESGIIRQGCSEVVLLGFTLDDDRFRLFCPVLVHETDDNLAAVRQAATMLYHDVKSRCVSAMVKGARWAFHAELILPNGMTAGSLTDKELMQRLPEIFRQPLSISHNET